MARKLRHGNPGKREQGCRSQRQARRRSLRADNESNATACLLPASEGINRARRPAERIGPRGCLFPLGSVGLIPSRRHGGAALGAGRAKDRMTMMKFSLAIHGGAGTLRREAMTAQAEAEYREGLRRSLMSGYRVLKQ